MRQRKAEASAAVAARGVLLILTAVACLGLLFILQARQQSDTLGEQLEDPTNSGRARQRGRQDPRKGRVGSKTAGA